MEALKGVIERPENAEAVTGVGVRVSLLPLWKVWHIGNAGTFAKRMVLTGL